MQPESHDCHSSDGNWRDIAHITVHPLSECSRRCFERKSDGIENTHDSRLDVLINEALAIANGGIPVFPVNIKKQPLTKRGFHDASTDAVMIEEMFRRSAVAGIGIPTGPSSGLVVIDRDRKNGVDGIATCAELEAQVGALPKTLHQRTGSGGDQLFFQYPEGVEVRCSAGKLGSGLDVRGLGGYAVIAPSVNTSGAYEWLNMLCPAQLPEVWVRKMAVNRVEAGLSARVYAPKIVATMSTHYGRAALVSECRLLAQAPQGTRHDQLFKSVAAIASLVAGGEIVESEARVAIAAAIQSWTAGAESEPKTLKTIEDAWSRGMTASRQATRNSCFSDEKSSGRSGESGRASERGENIDPNVSNPKSGLVDSSRVILPEGYALNAEGVWFVAKSADPDEPDEKIWLGPRLQFLACTRNVSSEGWGLLLSWEDPDRRLHEYVMPYSLLTDSRQAWRAELSSRGWLGATNAKAKSLLVQLFLIRELALECGYNAASIRERIYAKSDGASPMAGVLLYTAAADSDGTLGGLVELGKPENLGRLIEQALDRSTVCSSDPLCSEHNPGIDRSLHSAACHACTFVAETSCERGNRYLDRALLVKTFEATESAFFADTGELRG